MKYGAIGLELLRGQLSKEEVERANPDAIRQWDERYGRNSPNDIIAKVLNRMEHIRVVSQDVQEIRLTDLNEVGVFAIDFEKKEETETTKRNYLFNIFSREVTKTTQTPLSSLESVAVRLSNVPLVGHPVRRDENWLFYSFLVGATLKKAIYYEHPQERFLFDRALVVCNGFDFDAERLKQIRQNISAGK